MKSRVNFSEVRRAINNNPLEIDGNVERIFGTKVNSKKDEDLDDDELDSQYPDGDGYWNEEATSDKDSKPAAKMKANKKKNTVKLKSRD